MAESSAPPSGRRRKKVLADYLVRLRWIPVILVALPLSALIYLSSYLRETWSAMKSEQQRQREHEVSVRRVVARLKQRNPKKDGLVCTARKPWTVVGMRNVDYKRARHFGVDLSALGNILAIDGDRLVAWVEPLVSMGQLSRATCPMNLALAVAPEFDDLTVGGLINSYGISGSSHLHGLFSDTVLAMEVVLADGRVVRATKDNEHSDLFYGMPWSQGTLGLLVSAEMKLIRIKEYMRVTYTPVRGSLRDMAQAYADSFLISQPDFVEGMVYSPSTGVMMTGVYASEEEAKREGNRINRVGRWFKPWFYQYAQQKAKEEVCVVEYIPTREYYHRHTRSLYWEAKLILPFADQLWFRLLLGWLMPPKISLLKITQGEAIRNYYHDRHVIQDVLVPLHKLGDALEFLHREMEVYPVWLCPHRLYRAPVRTMVQPEPGHEAYQMFTDVGVYYAPGAVLRGEDFDGAEAVRRLEHWLIRNHGYQAQYAVSELSEDDFWRMFDAAHYHHCRRKYGAEGTFMTAYYKSKKGTKTRQEVEEAEKASRLQAAHAQ